MQNAIRLTWMEKTRRAVRSQQSFPVIPSDLAGHDDSLTDSFTGALRFKPSPLPSSLLPVSSQYFLLLPFLSIIRCCTNINLSHSNGLTIMPTKTCRNWQFNYMTLLIPKVNLLAAPHPYSMWCLLWQCHKLAASTNNYQMDALTFFNVCPSFCGLAVARFAALEKIPSAVAWDEDETKTLPLLD